MQVVLGVSLAAGQDQLIGWGQLHSVPESLPIQNAQHLAAHQLQRHKISQGCVFRLILELLQHVEQHIRRSQR